MNTQIALLGLQSWKPLIAALLLPPVPLLLLVLAGAGTLRRRPWLGWTLVAISVAGFWLSACEAPARWLEAHLLAVPPALSAGRIAELKQAARADPTHSRIAIVILGGGRDRFAPEYGEANLEWASLERLRYGIRLARAIGAPAAFSGGTGWAQPDGPPEAQIAARIAREDFGMRLRWVEDASNDTRENASRSLALLGPDGVRDVVLVTHGWHMARAVRAFEAAARGGVKIVPAPMGLALSSDGALLDWFPSSRGATRARQVIREWIGAKAGA